MKNNQRDLLIRVIDYRTIREKAVVKVNMAKKRLTRCPYLW
jgi:hypothetical protein